MPSKNNRGWKWRLQGFLYSAPKREELLNLLILPSSCLEYISVLLSTHCSRSIVVWKEVHLRSVTGNEAKMYDVSNSVKCFSGPVERGGWHILLRREQRCHSLLRFGTSHQYARWNSWRSERSRHIILQHDDPTSDKFASWIHAISIKNELCS